MGQTTKHTPGPWWSRWGGEPGYIYSSTAGRVVAEVLHERSDDQPRPDSQLMSAAPDLFAELRKVEWAGTTTKRMPAPVHSVPVDACPACKGVNPSQWSEHHFDHSQRGHKPGCSLAAALAKAST